MSTRSRKIMFREGGGVKRGRCLGLTTLPPCVSRLSRQCGILNISQPCRPPWPVTGTVLIFKHEVFLDKVSCTPVEVSRRFGGAYHLYRHCWRERKVKIMNQIESRATLKRLLTFAGLHDAIFQKIEWKVWGSLSFARINYLASFPYMFPVDFQIYISRSVCEVTWKHSVHGHFLHQLF
jgi:hypothetical protein